MNMKKINTIILLIVIAFVFSSCDDFLSKRPSKQSAIVPSTMEDLELILVGTWREDCSSDHVTYGGGDIQLLPELEAAANGSYKVSYVQAGTWERKESGLQVDYMWRYRWQNIFKANLAVYELKNVPVTEDEKNEVLAKAAFRRAISYMELLNIYTLPYCEENLEEPGLVLTTQIGYDYSLKRASIKDTYDFIEKDILTALTIKAQLINRTGANSPYRVTKAAANALASRFYLMKHDYANAKKYAEEAIKLYGWNNVLDYNTIGYYATPTKGTITVNGTPINFEANYPATRGWNTDLQWTEDIFTNMVIKNSLTQDHFTALIPSDDFIACFDADGSKENDARYKYFFIEDYLYAQGKAVTKNIPCYYKPKKYTLSVPEMIMNIAECEARVGDYDEAINIVNQLRAKRIAPGSGEVNLSASSRDEAIAKVLRERRREMGPFKRLYDVRRYNSNDYAADDVTLTQKFYSYTSSAIDRSSAIQTYTLKPDAREYAAMIPEADVMASNGELLQNTY